MVAPRIASLASSLASSLVLLGCITCSLGSVAAGADDRAGQLLASQLLEGVEAISTSGNPATLVLWGDAIPLVVGPDGRVYAAATHVGTGRAIALGHDGYFTDTRADTPVFLASAVEWAGDGAIEAGRPLRVYGLPGPVKAELDRRGIPVETIEGDVKGLVIENVDVVFTSPQAWAGAGRLDDLREWLENGGGLIAGECSWGQLSFRRAASLQDLACNRLFAQAGVMWTEVAASAVRNGVYPVELSIRRVGNAQRALEFLDTPGLLESPQAADRDTLAVASRVAADALLVVQLDSPLIAQATAIRTKHAQALASRFRSIDELPLTPEADPLARAIIDLDARLAMEVPATAITEAHASAQAFPGPYTDKPITKALITLDTAIPGWRSTGLWAIAGEQITVVIDPGLADAGITLQIGCWLDEQTFPERVRLARVTRRFALDSPKTVVGSVTGGPISIDLPPRFAETSAADAIEIKVTGSLGEYPHFRLGHTDLGEWNRSIRSRGAAWAELESDDLVLTVPADVVRSMDRPDRVMEHWDRVHQVMQSLEPRSPRHWPDRQYRYVCERRLSAGYMYCPSNAPIVIPMSAAAEMVDLDSFDAEGPLRLWGHYHEMGHAHQNPMWTFSGTGEVTVNIFTVYALHRINGYSLDHEAMRTSPKVAWERFEKHVAEGAPFKKWKRDPFLALQTYAMLWQAFGFEPFQKVFERYRSLPSDERPKTDEAKRDLFMVMFSEAVNRDMSGYFRGWGIPISDAAVSRVAGLEPWSPVKPKTP